MMLKAFAIYDTAAQAFMPPVFYPAVGQMVRAFTDAVNNPESQFSKHPADYRLALIGSFDDSSGQLDVVSPVQFLGFGTDFVNKKPHLQEVLP